MSFGEGGHAARNIGLVVATGGFIIASLFVFQLGPFAKGISTSTSITTTSDGSFFTSVNCPYGIPINCTTGTYSVINSSSSTTTGSSFGSKSCWNQFGLFC